MADVSPIRIKIHLQFKTNNKMESKYIEQQQHIQMMVVVAKIEIRIYEESRDIEVTCSSKFCSIFCFHDETRAANSVCFSVSAILARRAS